VAARPAENDRDFVWMAKAVHSIGKARAASVILSGNQAA
jgi:hypothetical protein